MNDGDLDLAINGGTLVLPDATVVANLGIRGGTISTISDVPLQAERVIDAPSALVLPGIIDSHLHFQLYQGRGTSAIVTQDDYQSGPLQAAHGGVTTFIDYVIPHDHSIQETIAQRRTAADQGSCIDFAFHGALVRATPDTLKAIPELVEQGVTSFKFFLTYKDWGVGVDLGFLHAAFQEIARAGCTASVHCEHDEIIEHLRELYHAEGRTDLIYHSLSRPDFSEAIAVDEAIAVAHEAGVPLHVVHLSTAKGLEVIRRARQEGRDVTTETCPHYLAFSDEIYQEERGLLYTMTPPLRPPGNSAALWEGIRKGTIDLLGSDHNGFSREQKLDEGRRDFYCVAPGVPGTETLLPFAFTHGYLAGRVTLPHLAQLLATKPAERFGLERRGKLEVGFDGDVVILDPNERRVMGPDTSLSTAGYSIFDGMELAGWPVYTVSRGTIVFDHGRFVGDPAHGRFIARTPSKASRQLVGAH
jgi:dihydropyrimidinase